MLYSFSKLQRTLIDPEEVFLTCFLVNFLKIIAVAITNTFWTT